MRGLRGSAARDDQEIENRHVRRRINETDLNPAAYRYDATMDGTTQCIDIGAMDFLCQDCNVRKFPSETLLLCCFVYKNTYILYID